ncbi:unnamed protein product [Agarophyton chilense]
MGDDERVEVQGVLYSLCAAPPADSPLVRHHLGALPSAVPTLSEHFCELSTHVAALSQFDALQAVFPPLLAHVGNLGLQRCLTAVYEGCVSILMQQPLTFHMILSSPFQNESLKHFSRMASALSRMPLQCVAVLQQISSCLSTLSTRLRDTQQALNATLDANQQKLSALRIQTVSIHQQQSQLLQQLSEYAQQYSHAQASAQRMSHRQTLCNILSFVPSMDQSLRTSYNWHVLQPLSNAIQSVHHQHEQSQQEKEHILNIKRQQRERNRLLLSQLATCEAQTRQVQVHIQRNHDLLKHVAEATQVMHKIGVHALRISTAFKSISHTCQALSSSQLATLIDLTCTSSSHSSCSSIPAATCDEHEQPAVLDVSHVRGEQTWSMKTAVKRKFVEYYAQWAALKWACQRCLSQLSSEKRLVPHICWDAFEHGGGGVGDGGGYSSDVEQSRDAEDDNSDR